MNFQPFNLDTASAKKADSEGSRISQTGKYVGKIIRFEFVHSKKGTQGVEIFFEDDDNNEANMTLWTFSADGTPIFGRDKVNALMACTMTKTLTPTEAQVEKYDYDLKAKIVQPVTMAPELVNKRVGFLIQMEEYINDAGEVKSKPTLVSSFQADTGLMAKEILDRKTSPEQLEKAYARLMKNGDKKVKQEQQSNGGGYGNNQSAPSGAGGATSDLDDDLPFDCLDHRLV